MLKLYLVGLSYLLTVTNLVRCEPDYLFNHEARGWLKLHTAPDIWEEALLRCHYEDKMCFTATQFVILLDAYLYSTYLIKQSRLNLLNYATDFNAVSSIDGVVQEEGAVLASRLNDPLTKALHSLLQESQDISVIFLGTHDLFSKGDFISIEGVPQDSFASFTEDCGVMGLSPNSSYYYFQTSPCNNPLPYICYRKFDNQTLNKCGTFDNAYQLNEHTGSCYKVHHEKRNWTTAYRICAAEGGHLVILNDKEEARIVRDLVPTKLNQWQSLHVGLVAWGEDRTWMSIHGHTIEDVYHDWAQLSYREIIDERYGNIDDMLLSPVNDRYRSKFICEKSPDSIRFEAAPVR